MGGGMRDLGRVMASLAVAVGLGAAPAAAAEPPPQLEAYLSYPFIGELTAAPSGDRLAWVETRKGVRNVWCAASPDYAPRKLTDGRTDDGQELAALAFSPDGRTLARTRGGGEHNPWADGLPAPNPASALAQPKMEIWVSQDGGPPKRVAEDGEEPALSASGMLAYVKEGQVWAVDLRKGGAPSRLFYDRGKAAELAWSPDGGRLAFVSRRGDHSFIGVYAGPERPIAWMAPATAFDGDPVWSPDGRRLAFSRQDGVSDVLASSLVERPNPFSIWVANVDDGEAHAAWRSPATLEGSAPDIDGGLFLRWAAGDRLTFRAELDGWPHLYALPAAGGPPTLLTPGAFMVEHVALSPDRRSLVYSANAGVTAGDVDRRHVFRVAVDRPGGVALTTGEGLEFTPAPLGGDAAAYVSSTPTTAPRVVLGGNGAGKARPLGPATPEPMAGFVAPKPVTFAAADGLRIHGQMFSAPSGPAKKPGLIFVHGGPPRQMLLGFSYMDYYAHAYAMNQYYAAHGYVVLSVNYRLGIGYGRAFQHPAKAGPAGNAEYQDVTAGARFLQAQASVDAARIDIWGGSYGGLLTAHALARDSATFKAGVDFHGVHDWSLYPGICARLQRYEQGDHEAATRTAFESSPEAVLRGWTSPVLLIHGDDDRNVRFDQTTDLARRLRAQATPFEELILPNELHGFLRYDSWLRADAAAVRFLEGRLKP